MRLHGGYPPPRLSAADRAEPEPAETSGYRNLFGPAHPSDLFRGYGFGTPDEVRETARLLEAVASRLGYPYAWKQKLAPDIDIRENPDLPSGYTYLAQFVAHDLTFVQPTHPPIPHRPTHDRNLRGAGLELDTLYGSSPADRPGAYSAGLVPRSAGHERIRLRLGYYNDTKVASRLSDDENRRRARDVPRFDPGFHNDTAAGLTDTLLADPRNDDQPMIAQVTVLFALLHNAVCDRLAALEPRLVEAQGGPLAAARRATRAVYRGIVQQDLLRRLLDVDVYRAYTQPGAALLDRSADQRLAVEFSHAGYRFGHAMVRPHYSFNEESRAIPFGLRHSLTQNSGFRPDEMPLKPIWIAQWSYFFPLRGRPANLSRRIGPEFATVLLDDARFETISLARRDLMRGATQVRSVASLVRELEKRGVGLPACLKDAAARQQAVRDWLARPFCDLPYLQEVPLSEQDIDTLAADPPLILFLLLEAALTADGRRLGFLGSIIVAETMFAALGRHRESPDADGSADDMLGRIFPGQVPNDMAALITLLNAHYRFDESELPFV
jgi:hypothetical protein